MSNELQKQLKGYYRKIKRNLSGKPATSQYLHSFKNGVAEYIEEHSITDISEIYMHFGTPEQIAEAYLDEASHVDFSKKVRKLKLFRIVACIVILLMILFFVFFLHELREGYPVESYIYIEESK